MGNENNTEIDERPLLGETPEPIAWEDAFDERGPEIGLMDRHVNGPKIDRFFNSARRGKVCGSGGEQRAHKLALLMSRAIEEAVGTDLEVVEGAALLMCYAAQGGDGYCLMRRFLDENGYKRGAR